MNSFDVIVIGGGPAGMMAALRAAQMGASVLLLEKNDELGRKLGLTGRGRCNFAHDEPDAAVLAQGYGKGAAFMEQALREFGLNETVAFFASCGVRAVRERGKRLYPQMGQDSSAVTAALRRELHARRVLVLSSTEVKGLDASGGKIRRVITRQGEIDGRAFVLATGGQSFPATGSTGDGYRWAKRVGCTIEEPRPAICPVKCREKFCAELNGLKLKNVRLTLFLNGEPVDERFGEMDFAPFGVTGATAMDMAARIGELLPRGKLRLRIDLKPALDRDRFIARLDREFPAEGDLPLRFALRKMLPKEIIPVVIRLAGLQEGDPAGSLTPENKAALVDAMKEFSVTPTELAGFRWAIVTRGGVSLDDVNPKTMACTKVPNLFFAGELLDVDGPTGGYNLQACWTTGWLAGQSAAELLGYHRPAPAAQKAESAARQWRGHAELHSKDKASGRRFPARTDGPQKASGPDGRSPRGSSGNAGPGKRGPKEEKRPPKFDRPRSDGGKKPARSPDGGTKPRKAPRDFAGWKGFGAKDSETRNADEGRKS